MALNVARCNMALHVTCKPLHMLLQITIKVLPFLVVPMHAVWVSQSVCQSVGMAQHPHIP